MFARSRQDDQFNLKKYSVNAKKLQSARSRNLREPMPNRDEEKIFEEAINVANIPTLLMVIVQLTGELHWLDAPYAPARAAGLGDNDTGGLSEEHQIEVREAALEAILAWRDGRPLALAAPDEELIVRMLSVAMAEPVPEEYGQFTAAQLGQVKFLDRDPIETPEGFKVLVIGAGVSGLCAAINLKQLGVDYQVIERNATVGGVWWENRYPGAGVDTPNHLYSYSFAPFDWDKYFCLRSELHDYLEHVCDQFEVRDTIRFSTSVDHIEYQSSRQTWQVQIRSENGEVELLEANVVISAAGIFNPPVSPDIDGLDSWVGEKWHTARWPEEADLKDKRVAIIGNGASCMQTAPEIQDDVESLAIYQRSVHWAAPFDQFRKPVPEALRFLLREVPLYRNWYRVRLGWTFNDRIHSALQKDPNWEHPERSLNAQNDAHRAYFSKYVEDELGDKADELLEKVLPTYPPFGKRMLMDNGWYRMLRKDNVELIDDRIERIDKNKIISSNGEEREADVLILATGFDVLNFITTYDAVGRTGESLASQWQNDNAKAYLGTVVPDFPNLFTLYGPNLQPGHGGSLIFVVEMQVRYIMDIISKMTKEGIGAVEIRQDVHDEYNAKVDAAHENMVWTHEGMTSYYRNDRGRIVVNSPWRNVDYYEMTREADLDEYIVEPLRSNELIAD
ncbi:MAG: 4-hydroxyacetophenone monooxygenase [Candidatus Poriferisodalaceae bacterium]|jgi:4-hydroxyacetophenone monooxygenase|tara:strand:- start:12388 stop:14415 length:2028 start_codon:yes stop_codon:yes gene_type:complete